MEIVEKMAKQFDENILSLKTVEECTELSEVLIKRVTKAENMKPPIEKVIEEMGDAIFRMSILAEKLGIGEKVAERVDEKASIIATWFKDKFEKQS